MTHTVILIFYYRYESGARRDNVSNLSPKKLHHKPFYYNNQLGN